MPSVSVVEFLVALAICFGPLSVVGLTTPPQQLCYARRTLVLGAIGSAAYMPAPSSASYAMQQAAQSSFDERQSTNWKPVATDDSETLAALQAAMDEKRKGRASESDLGALSYTKRSASSRYERGGIDDSKFLTTDVGTESKYEALPTEAGLTSSGW
jgi:hypothetical protein